MSNISTVSLTFFIASGIILVIAILVFIMAYRHKRSDDEENKERLTLLNEVMLIHTSESIEQRPQIIDMKSK